MGCLSWIALLIVAFIKPLCSLAVHSVSTDVDSYILLVPFISAYLLFNVRNQLPREYFSSPAFAMVPLGAGLAALAAPWSVRVWGWL